MEQYTTNNDHLDSQLDKLFNPDSYRGHFWARQFQVAGLNLIEEINELDPDLVIDAGCAHNRFKGHIKNLIGFDRMHFPFVDLHMKIEEANFRSQSADVVMALGSIHFGSLETIEQQIDRVVSWVKPGGFIVMRVNHKLYFERSSTDIRFLWSLNEIKYFTEKHSLLMHRDVVIEPRYNNDEKEILMAEKMVWWWKKPGERQQYKIDPVTCQISNR
jgi:hypothetical protein